MICCFTKRKYIKYGIKVLSFMVTKGGDELFLWFIYI